MQGVGQKSKSFLNDVKGKVLDRIGVQETFEDDMFDDKGPSSSKDQRQNLINRYGVEMELPAFYYANAKFVPHMPDHILTMAFHVIP
jgi:hypothetical protein